MKKLLSLILMVCLLIVPAYAEEMADQPGEDEVTQQKDYVVVSTFSELQEAIATAENGDTIAIASGIMIGQNEVVETDKKITLTRDDSFSAGPLIYIGKDGILKGFTIIDTNNWKNTLQMVDSATVQNCYFIGGENHYGRFIYVYAGIYSETSTITDCSFVDNGTLAIECGYGADAICNKCVFTGNMSYAIYNCGNMWITDCTITQNWHSGIYGLKSVTTVNNCQIYGNIPCDPKARSGADLCIEGTLIIGGENKGSEGYFDEITGTKIELPFEYCGTSKLIYLTDEQAIEHFAPPLQDEETDLSNPEDSGDEDNPSESPQEPGDQPEDDDTMESEQPPQEPTDPPKDDTEDNPVDNLPQEPETPEDTEQSNDPVDDAGTVPETPQEPQEPVDNASNDDTPPVDYRPIQRPIRPTVTVPTDSNTDTQAQTEPISTPTLSLVCNGAVIDTSRTIVLLGYGDELIHEDDPLTRAQLATIIYRLLDDEAIARYSGMESAFADVSADAWYAPYISVIGAAGIVNGVGGGRYAPNEAVTWAQIITILSRFVEPQEYELQHIQYDGWAEQAIQTAVAMDWIADSTALNPDAVISRGELVQLVNSVLGKY